MKNKQRNTITLKKLTIARINIDVMKKVKGGDCLPTEVHCDSYVYCESTKEVY
ncbi:MULTISPECIES: hypothetical protein [unclassified Aquimarina]|uniref:hypothetical protein n=1 Tax=unclassified Aquimarina TaxID=2627091 RepID=UPI00131EE5D9|nr:hypothetical protein [Aquimarina sp. Aq107]